MNTADGAALTGASARIPANTIITHWNEWRRCSRACTIWNV